MATVMKRALSSRSLRRSNIVIHESHPAGLPVVVGVPCFEEGLADSPSRPRFAEARLRGGESAMDFGELSRAAERGAGGLCQIVYPDGVARVAQYLPLTPRLQGGERWVEVSCLAEKSGPALVNWIPPKGLELLPLAELSNGGATLTNDTLRIELAASPERAAVCIQGNRPNAVLRGELRPEVVFKGGERQVKEAAEKRKVMVLRNGPIRAQVEIQGQLRTEAGAPGMCYRLTVELWKGLNAVRVDWMLAHLMPGRPSVDVERASLMGQWKVGAVPARRFVQKNHGIYYRRREVLNPAGVVLVADHTCEPAHVAEAAMLLDDSDYPAYLSPPTVATEEWLGLEGAAASVYARIVDFTATRPNALESREENLDYHMIPCGATLEWPQGRRKEQTLLLAMAGEHGADREEAWRQLQALSANGRATQEPGMLRQHKLWDMDKVLRDEPGRNLRLGALLDRCCRLNTPADKWNLGDTPDSEYTRGYASLPNHFFPRPGWPPVPAQYDATRKTLYPRAAGEFMEPVWTNNEYDIIHTLTSEILRTGRPDHCRMLRWAARHVIEVDFVAFSDDRWLHRGAPFHSHHHNRKGVIASHLWTQGLLQYYLLTGERDALEVALAFGDKILEITHSEKGGPWQFDRETGWALLSLVCLVDAGFDRYRAACDELADFLVGYDRKIFQGAVNLSFGRPDRSLERQMVDNAFGYASMMEAMDLYQRLSGREDVKDWLHDLLYGLLAETRNAIREGEIPSLFFMVTQMLAIGYERTGDADFLKPGLVILDHFFDQLLLGDPGACWGQVKPMAMLHRALGRFLGHADGRGYLKDYEYRHLIQVKRMEMAE